MRGCVIPSRWPRSDGHVKRDRERDIESTNDINIDTTAVGYDSYGLPVFVGAGIKSRCSCDIPKFKRFIRLESFLV